MSDKNYKPVLPKDGQLMFEDVDSLVLCKPRLIPLKSFTLEKLEKMQQTAQVALQEHKLNSEASHQAE